MDAAPTLSNLNVMCGICTEFYKANDVIFTTSSCGHVFHKECLMRWLFTSRTCPQCRAMCHRQRTHRIYLNFGERTALDDEEIEPPAIQWVPLDLDESNPPKSLLDKAIQCGTDDEGNDTYVARVYYADDLLPANYVPSKQVAYAPYGCHAHTLTDQVDILIDCEHKWVPAENGQVPPQAIQTGYSEIGETLYTARATYQEFTLLGKVHPSHRVIYMPFRGQEVNSSQYEVLVLSPKDQADR
ncbi:uncharacterized protein LOC115633666 [Scaptodrosophila lebanonensis]|uniref:Uncharacterized protein LOC115633666 n=1 Tax=Drosophila lebanonensis TaxID=7225 RepID=A0A6J2UFQ3_DROLE|nr:uncharacterized protein LOC115633666 [Scaptodrosophila lebanonensis]